MRHGDQIREEVEKTLLAFDHDLPLEPNPFLFTRIQAERATHAPVTAAAFWQVRWRHVVIAGLLIINLVTVIQFADWSTEAKNHEALVTELEREFSTGTTLGGL